MSNQYKKYKLVDEINKIFAEFYKEAFSEAVKKGITWVKRRKTNKNKSK